ncbi:MAG: RidA family protein [Bacteroidetes bacterium]|nr:RidA family protein [Bacteroidota bacterium]
MREIVYTKNAPEPIGPYSQAVRAGNTWYFSGQIAIDPASGQVIPGDAAAQTVQVMKNIGALLKEAGLDFSDIAKTTIFLKDMNEFPRVNEVYGSYFTGKYPARETVEVSRLPKDVLVEISVTCWKHD